ncbi:MAG: haloacid dehalogenase [Methanoculleus sp. SDB]|nr:MAG: haloacid dehalogenase [Methanoculleus sp. SDB]
MSNLNVLILDFDGVILESVLVKTDAFRELFSFAPEHLDEIVNFHLNNGGMSRFDKFRYIYAHILLEPLSEERFLWLGSRFSELVFDGVLASSFVDGAEELLRVCSKHIPLFIVSATPEGEIREIVRRRNLDRYFTGVYGSPRSKSDCIRAILAMTGVPPESVLFVGDAHNDLQAAKEAGVRFVGRVTPRQPNRFTGEPGVDHVISDLYELYRYIRAEYGS